MFELILNMIWVENFPDGALFWSLMLEDYTPEDWPILMFLPARHETVMHGFDEVGIACMVGY